MKKLRVLLITRECLRTDSNEGNVLLSLFQGQPMELANICCKPGAPDTDLCAATFQLTDRMALDNLLRRAPMGRRVEPALAEAAPEKEEQVGNKAFYDFFRRHNLPVFFCAQELLWKLADFRGGGLEAFVKEFAPEAIFAPLCYSRFALAIQRYVIGLAGAPAVTYLYDDLYSLRQLRFSPVYWLNRFLQRAAIRKTLPCYRFAYTMTEQQADEYGKILGVPMKVLRKCADLPAPLPPQDLHEGVRLIYAGGVYYGRDRTLAEVAAAVRTLRAEGRSVTLDVYTASPLSRKARTRLDDGAGCRVHPAVSYAALQEIYRQSDVALHVEGFRKKDALVTRLSFSTKIVDCLASGCAVLAVCPGMNAGWQYLQAEDAALCVCASQGVEAAVRKLVCQPELRREYAQKAAKCLRENHDPQRIREELLRDLTGLVSLPGEQRTETEARA